MAAALAAGARVESLFTAPELLPEGRAEPLLADAERRGAEVVEVAAAALESIVRGRRADGLLAVVRRPTTTLARLRPGGEAVFVVAVGIERPGNLGTIVRTACAAGADALIVADPCTDVFHRDVIRGSVGSVFLLPCATAASEVAVAWLRGGGMRILAATPAARTPYWDAHYAGAVAIVVGCERHGLPEPWLRAASEEIAIPMPGPADSLNVAVAAGVVLCEAMRARGLRGAVR